MAFVKTASAAVPSQPLPLDGRSLSGSLCTGRNGRKRNPGMSMPTERVEGSVGQLPKRKRRRLLTPDVESEDAGSDVADPVLQTPPKPRLPPTPPPSQHRPGKSHIRLDIEDFDLASYLGVQVDGFRADTVPLPARYEAALAQHAALERGLVLYLATEGGRAAGKIANASTDSTGALRAHLTNVLSYTAARKMVEAGSRKRLGEEELARLLWLWDLGTPLGYSVSAMREMDANGKRTHTYGLSIELTAQHHAPTPTLELVGAPHVSPSSRHTHTNARDSMSIVALWNQASEGRIAQIRRRLGAFTIWQLHQGHSTELDDPLPLPCAPLPELRRRSLSNGSSSLTGCQDLLDRPPATPSSSPAKGSGTLANRATSQLERIKAKQAAKAKGLSSTSVVSATGETESVRVDTPGERMEELKERSALSRLAVVADGLHLLFSSSAVLLAPPWPSASLPTPPTRKRRAVPLDEVTNLIAKSSRIALSDAEARDALALLSRICPGFISIREIDRRLWVASVGEASLRDTKDAIKAALAR